MGIKADKATLEEARSLKTALLGQMFPDKCLAAYTPPGSTYPPYVSINYRNTMVEITVRSSEQEDGTCGSVATIKMNLFHFGKLIDEARANVRTVVLEDKVPYAPDYKSVIEKMRDEWKYGCESHAREDPYREYCRASMVTANKILEALAPSDEHARLKEAVVEAAKAWNKEYNNPLGAISLMGRSQILRKAVSALIEFERTTGAGE